MNEQEDYQDFVTIHHDKLKKDGHHDVVKIFVDFLQNPHSIYGDEESIRELIMLMLEKHLPPERYLALSGTFFGRYTTTQTIWNENYYWPSYEKFEEGIFTDEDEEE